MFPRFRRQDEPLDAYDQAIERARRILRGDCTPDERAAIEVWLRAERKAGRVVKGRVLRGVPVLPGERD